MAVIKHLKGKSYNFFNSYERIYPFLLLPAAVDKSFNAK